MTMIEKAVIFAVNAHAGTKRKGKDRLYILHPLEAMTIVGSITEDENVLAAAVLHDTVEDTDTTREDILRNFGPRVAELVDAESENKREDQKAEDTWQIRKQQTIDHLKDADRDAKLICLGDKLANLREISRDYESLGPELWQRFNQRDPEMHGWYYRSLFEVLEQEFKGAPAIEEYAVLLGKVFS